MKTALVTGAYKGLGLEWCRQLAQLGYHVILTARNAQQAIEAAEKLTTEGLAVTPQKLDITHSADIEALAQWISAAVGHLDVLINNAGINSGTRAKGDTILQQQNIALDSLKKEEVLSMIDINALSPILLAHALRPLLAKADSPKVINIGSWLGAITLKKNGGNYSYAISKSALNMMNRAFAFDVVNEQITSVVVNPGWVQTDMGGKRANFTPQESVASLIEHVLQRITIEDTGKFFNYDGTIHPW